MIDLQPSKQCPGWSAAERHLAAADPVLRNVISRVGPCTLCPRPNYFAALCQSIITQQISTAVAVTIYGRFRRLFPAGRPTPARLAALPEAALRAVGLSRQKLSYLRALAEAFQRGDVPVRRLRRMSDEQVIDTLIPLRGIGRWTAEMFLIFVLNRPDVLPVDDFGLRNGARQLYGLEKMPAGDELVRIGEAWRPWRSVATWYIWRGMMPNAPPPRR